MVPIMHVMLTNIDPAVKDVPLVSVAAFPRSIGHRVSDIGLRRLLLAQFADDDLKRVNDLVALHL